ncbi:hypothetical protein M9Y10_043278 [Tritrichomonas musculus]|uniref:DUF3447 domain-containing protein n=1 Tax=Tritrichomonas musculus TaxID=1915356 RepID=A0ABR2JZN3_9EUKA
MKYIYEIIIDYLEEEDELAETRSFENLLKYFQEQKIRENKYDLKEVLHIIIRISNNHHRTINFSEKIEKVLTSFQDDIKQTFSNWEIFNIFKSSKRMLLFLFENNILIPDKNIFHILKQEKYEKMNYLQFFKIEFNQFKKFKAIEFDTELFKQKRKIGENDDILCNLIRNDLIKEFIVLFNKTNFSLNSEIESSIFETNSFLIDKKPTLIQYSAFFGSIQIFQFLKINNVCLEPSIWKYAIHGKNAEIIHLLEENDVSKETIDFDECLKESIKCHHNDISNYIQNNFIQSNNKRKLLLQKLKYYNFNDFPNEMEIDSELFYYLCKYDYINVVDFLLSEGKIEIKRIIVLILNSNEITSNFLNKVFHLFLMIQFFT